MFHAKDGLYFERLTGGSVRILVKRQLPEQSIGGAPRDEGAIEVVLDSLTWACVVASATRRGDLKEVFEAVFGVA